MTAAGTGMELGVVGVSNHLGQLVRSPITRNELITLVTVRTLSQKAGVTMRNVRTALIIDHNWDNGRGLTYDQTNRALASLVRKGYLEKPTRGWYREVD